MIHWHFPRLWFGKKVVDETSTVALIMNFERLMMKWGPIAFLIFSFSNEATDVPVQALNSYSQNGSNVPPNIETLIGNFEVENET